MPHPSAVDLVVMEDGQALARHTASWLAGVAQGIAERAIAIALSGGSTPRALFELLAQPEYRSALPWRRIHWFWSDERFVPPTDDRSNYRLAHELFLEAASVPRENIHAIPTATGTPAAAAQAYEQTLRAFYGARQLTTDRPLFDVMLLGIGADGHTASLFPGSSVLRERSRWVAAVADARPEPRVTLTYPALESSREVAFLATGAAKQPLIEAIFRGDCDLPAARVRPVGRLHWFVDRAAAPVRAS